MAKWHKAVAPRVEQATRRYGYWLEKAKLDFAIKVNRLLEDGNITKTELAQRIGTTQPYITKALRGDANLTIETMVKIAHALDAHLAIDVRSRSIPKRWERPIREIERSVRFGDPSRWIAQREVYKPANDADLRIRDDEQAEADIAA